MRRLLLFIGALRWGARLQMVAVVMMLGLYAWLDYQKGYWPVTIAVALTAWLIGWLLKPLMVAHPRRTTWIWNILGILVLIFILFAHRQRWWRLLITRFAKQFFLWLDVSCGYWFLSELQLQQRQAVEQMKSDDDKYEEFDHDQDETSQASGTAG